MLTFLLHRRPLTLFKTKYVLAELFNDSVMRLCNGCYRNVVYSGIAVKIHGLSFEVYHRRTVRMIDWVIDHRIGFIFYAETPVALNRSRSIYA